MRKEAGFEVTMAIDVEYTPPDCKQYGGHCPN